MMGTQAIMSPEIPSSPLGDDYGQLRLGLTSHLNTRGMGGREGGRWEGGREGGRWEGGREVGGREGGREVGGREEGDGRE